MFLGHSVHFSSQAIDLYLLYQAVFLTLDNPLLVSHAAETRIGE